MRLFRFSFLGLPRSESAHRSRTAMRKSQLTSWALGPPTRRETKLNNIQRTKRDNNKDNHRVGKHGVTRTGKRKVKKTLSTDLKILLKTIKRRASDCLGPLKTQGGQMSSGRAPRQEGNAGSKMRCKQYSRVLERVLSSNDLSVTEGGDRSPNPRLPNNQTAGSV